MAGASLKVRRTQRRREPSIYFVALVFGGGGVYLLLQVFKLVAWALDGLGNVEPGMAALYVSGIVVLGVLGVSIVWMAIPMWQLILRPGRLDDVVVEVGEAGVTLADAGYRVQLPWAALEEVDIIERGNGWYRLLLRAPGDVDITRDPVGRMVGRQLRKDGMTLRFTDAEPTERELVAAVATHSGGRFLAETG